MHRRFPGSCLSLAFCTIIVATLPQFVFAQSSPLWTASFGLGWNQAKDANLDDIGGTMGFDLGTPAVSAAFGIALENAWRLEVEGAYLSNDTEILYFPETEVEIDLDSSDRVTATSLMFNTFRDFDVGIALRPYVGVGVGVTRVKYRVGEAVIDGIVQRPRIPIIDDKDTAVAYQLIAGFSMPLTRQLNLDADYRFWQAPSVQVHDVMDTKIDTKHTIHSVWLRLRYQKAGDTEIATSTDSGIPASAGFYLSAKAGAGHSKDAEILHSLKNFDAFSIGPVAVLAVGYDYGERWRFELEVAGRKNNVEIVDFNPEFGEYRSSGRVRSGSLMTNVIYRFLPGSAIRPHVGAGVGVVSSDYKVSIAGETFVDDKDSALVYQAIFGVGIAMSRRLSFSADFRVWQTAALKMHQPDNTPLDTKQQILSVMAGLHYSLKG